MVDDVFFYTPKPLLVEFNQPSEYVFDRYLGRISTFDCILIKNLKIGQISFNANISEPVAYKNLLPLFFYCSFEIDKR